MGFFTELYGIRSEIECECPQCGYKTKTNGHCKDIKCPKCNIPLRRVDRPGKGKK